jgi:quercetin dioxygenase-like cupin family protein
LLSKEDTVGMRSGLMTLAPGQDCGWHSTENYEEMIICLAGSGELASEDGTRRRLAAAQYGYNPPQTRHNVFNTGSEPMRYIYVVAPVRPADAHGH